MCNINYTTHYIYTPIPHTIPLTHIHPYTHIHIHTHSYPYQGRLIPIKISHSHRHGIEIPSKQHHGQCSTDTAQWPQE